MAAAHLARSSFSRIVSFSLLAANPAPYITTSLLVSLRQHEQADMTRSYGVHMISRLFEPSNIAEGTDPWDAAPLSGGARRGARRKSPIRHRSHRTGCVMRSCAIGRLEKRTWRLRISPCKLTPEAHSAGSKFLL